jgi:hypothetical protein
MVVKQGIHGVQLPIYEDPEVRVSRNERRGFLAQELQTLFPRSDAAAAGKFSNNIGNHRHVTFSHSVSKML